MGPIGLFVEIKDPSLLDFFGFNIKFNWARPNATSAIFLMQIYLAKKNLKEKEIKIRHVERGILKLKRRDRIQF